MAYSAPRTWVAGELVTAAYMNQEVRDNLNAQFPTAAVAWSSYTPTLTQSGAVTKTVTYAKYIQIGKTVIVQVFLDVTGTGTGANVVLVGLPVTAAQNGVKPQEVGTGTVYDLSAVLAYKGQAILQSSTTVQFRASGTSSGVLGSTDFTAALASGDQISFTAMYEAA
jgi:hypothetical protein